MAKDSDPLAGTFETRESGLLSGLLAEENEFDRRTMWRLGTWGAVAVGAVVVAVMANQAQFGWRRDQVAAADFARQSQQLQVLTKESQNEARKLASAIDTLNTDRDRLYTRVTVLEQGLDSVTGAIKQNGAPAAKPQDGWPVAAPPVPQLPAPNVAPVASTPGPDKPRVEAATEPAKEPSKEQPSLPPQSAAAASLVPPLSALPTLPLVPQKSIMAPPDQAASKLVQAPEKTDKADRKAEKADKAEKTAEKPKTDTAKTDTANADSAKTAPAKTEPAKVDAAQPTEVAAASTAGEPEAAEAEPAPPPIPVQQTRFALDLGGASSISGLRALWQGVIKSNPEIAGLRPIIMVKEGKTGLGMQLRLGAGPLVNAAAAAKLCAGVIENERACDTTVFDGQRLSMRDSGPQDITPKTETPTPAAKPERHRRSYSSSKRSKREEPAAPPAAAAAAPPPKQESASSTLSSFFSRAKN